MEEDRQLPDDLPTLVAVAEWGDTEGAQDQFVMVHRVRKFVSSAVQRIIGHVIVVLQIRRSDVLGLRGFCNISHKSVFENCSTHLEDSICLDFFCGAAIYPAKEEDECEAHAAFLVEADGFGVMDCGATTSFEASKVQRLCSPRSMTMIHESQMLIFVGAGRSILEMVLRQRPHHCPDSQFEMRLLVSLGSLCTCSLTNQNRLR